MADITTGLLSHWKLDETGSTTTAVDSGSAGNDLTLSGFLSVADAWADDEGLFFAGANESNNDTATYSVITDYDNPAVTLTFRHKRVQPDSTYQIVFGIAYNFCIGFETDGSLIGYVYNGSSYQQNPLAGATKILDTNWHHIAATWDNATDTLKIYIDGVLETTTVLSGTTISYTSTDETGILVGGGATGYKGHGNFSNARIYSRALPLADIVAVAAADEPPPPFDIVSNLEGWWKLDEGDGESIVFDSSGNGIDLKLMNIEDVIQARTSGDGTYFGKRIDNDEYVHGPNKHDDFIYYHFTISAWVKMDTAGRSGEWIVGSSNDIGFYLHYGCVVAYIYEGGGEYTGTVDNIEDISDTEWHHVAFTWTDDTGIITVFLDGAELRSEGAYGNAISYVHNDNEDVWMARWFKGRQADTRWYSRVLTDADIAALANIPPDDPPVSYSSGLIAEWLFNEAASGTTPTTVYDGIGDGDLTIDYDFNSTWVDTDGRGIDFGTAYHESRVYVDNIPTNASAISTGLGSACQTASLVFVGEDLYGVSNGGRLFVLGTSTGNGLLAITLNDLGQTHELRYNEDSGEGFRFEFDNTYFNDGTNVFIMVVDTTQAALLDRVKLYKNGTLQTATYTGDCGSNSGQNATADFTGSTCNLNIMNRGDEQRLCTGVVHYAALFNEALSAAEVLSISTALLLNSDTTIEQPLPPLAGGRLEASNEIQGVAITHVPVSYMPLSGTVVATSGASGSLDSQSPLSGTTTATSTASAALDSQNPLSGTIATTSTASAALDTQSALSGQVDVVSELTGDLTLQNGLSTTVAVTTSVQGDLGVYRIATILVDLIVRVTDIEVSGTSSSSSGASAALDLQSDLSGDLSVTSTVAEAALDQQSGLSGTTDATSSIDGIVDQQSGLSSSSAATSSIDGDLDRQSGLAGSLSASSTVADAALDRQSGLSSSADATSTASAALDSDVRMSGQLAATSDTTGSLDVQPTSLLTGNINSVSGVSAALDLQNPLSVTVDASSTLSAALQSDVPLAAQIDAVSELTGNIFVQPTSLFTGTIASVSDASGALDTQSALSGQADSVSTVDGSVRQYLGLTGTIASAVSMDGAVKVDIEASGTAAAQSILLGDLFVELSTLFWVLNADGDDNVYHGQPDVVVSWQNGGAIDGEVEYGGILQEGVTWSDTSGVIAVLNAGELPLGDHTLRVFKPR